MKTAPEEMPPVAVVEVEKVEGATAPAVNDTSDALQRMVNDLTPLAARLKAAATGLLLISILMCGSLEGLFGMFAAMGVLCCAAPGTLGTAVRARSRATPLSSPSARFPLSAERPLTTLPPAGAPQYASRCTKICAMICAGLALGQLFCLAAVTVVMPALPAHMYDACEHLAAPPEAMKAHKVAGMEMEVVKAQDGSVPSPAMVPEPKGAAIVTTDHPMTVAIITTAARRLQEVAPESMSKIKCEKVEHFMVEIAPLLLLGAMVMETCLFLAALRTVKAAATLMRAARAYGANGM